MQKASFSGVPQALCTFKKCSEPETVGKLHHFHANRVRRPAIFVSGVRKKCKEPETVGKLHHFHANRVRRPAIFGSGVPEKCSEPEAVGDFHHGHANSLRRPAIFVGAGAQSLRLSAVFIMGMQTA